jgi:Na+-transporting NADH:ubiquinone oxidoreductase subunit NqrB
MLDRGDDDRQSQQGPDMELIIGTIAIVAVLIALAAVRVSRIASWRSVAMIAASTGSLRDCVAFIQHCERLQPNDHR